MTWCTSADHKSLEELKKEVNAPGAYDHSTWVISHPRSGNTYCRYILEHLTRFKSYGYIGSGAPDSVDNAGVLQGCADDFFDPTGIIKKRHGFYPEISEETSKKNVIFIVRNPIDVRWRCKSDWDKDNPRSFSWMFYLEGINDYLALDDCPKMVIRYEDLVDKTEAVIDRMLRFLDLSDKAGVYIRTNEFLANIDQHRQQSRSRAPESRIGNSMCWTKDLSEDSMRAEWDALKTKVATAPSCPGSPDYLGAYEFVSKLYDR